MIKVKANAIVAAVAVLVALGGATHADVTGIQFTERTDARNRLNHILTARSDWRSDSWMPLVINSPAASQVERRML